MVSISSDDNYIVPVMLSCDSIGMLQCVCRAACVYNTESTPSTRFLVMEQS